MSRRRYLVAYDIASPTRLRRICSIMEAYGERLQYSVFLCDLSAAEVIELEEAVTLVMHLTEDSVVQIDLGPTTSTTPIRCLGRPRHLPHSGTKIV